MFKISFYTLSMGLLHTLSEALSILPLAFSHDPAVVITTIGWYAAALHSLHLRSEILGRFSVNALLRIAKTSNLFVDAVLPKLKVTGFRPASTPFLYSPRIIPIMSFDTPAEFVLSLGRIKNPLAILVKKVIFVLLVHPSARAVQWPGCKQDVSVRIPIAFVMDRNVCTHSTLHKVFLHKLIVPYKSCNFEIY